MSKKPTVSKPVMSADAIRAATRASSKGNGAAVVQNTQKAVSNAGRVGSTFGKMVAGPVGGFLGRRAGEAAAMSQISGGPSTKDNSVAPTKKVDSTTKQKSKDIESGKTAAAGKSYSSKGGYRSGRAKGGLVAKPAKKGKK